VRVFISVDMEGVAGVATLDQVVRGGHGYPRAQELMTAEADAAIRGAFAGGATEVVVADSHGTMDNLIVERLDRRAAVVTGGHRPQVMMQGLHPGDAMAVFVGYHAAAGQHGVLAHTFSSNFTEVRLDGRPVSEAEVNALYSASFGVPVGVVTGDDQICALAEKSFPEVRTAQVKTAEGWASAVSLSPSDATDLIEATVADAVTNAERLARPPSPENHLLEVDFSTPLAADLASSVPGSVRAGGRTLRYGPAAPDEMISTIMAFYYMSAVAAQQFAAISQRR
jgi:D-amino peptidase